MKVCEYIECIKAYESVNNQIYSFKGGASSQALKRAKIIDSDNEEEVPGAEGGNEERPSQPLVDEGGESSDEGVRNDADQGCVKQFSFKIQIMKFIRCVF